MTTSLKFDFKPSDYKLSSIRSLRSVSVAWLVIANLFPLAGVVFFGWDLFSVLFLYWAENIVIGFYNFFKILKAKLPAKNPIQVTSIRKTTSIFAKSAYAIFFLFHYGVFTVVHGGFLFQLFGPGDLATATMITGLIFLFVSHGISYFMNFISKKEYLNVAPDQQLNAPYKRVMVMHFTVLLGAFAIDALGGPIVALLVLIALKTYMDLVAHSKEHSKIAIKNF